MPQLWWEGRLDKAGNDGQWLTSVGVDRHGWPNAIVSTYRSEGLAKCYWVNNSYEVEAVSVVLILTNKALNISVGTQLIVLWCTRKYYSLHRDIQFVHWFREAENGAGYKLLWFVICHFTLGSLSSQGGSELTLRCHTGPNPLRYTTRRMLHT